MHLAIKSCKKKTIGEPASLEFIKSTEDHMGVKFPTSYKEFLRAYGWAEIYGNYFFGVGLNIPSIFNLPKVSLDEHTIVQPVMPMHLIPVLNDGAGNHYCLDTSHYDGLNECKIAFWDHELNSDPSWPIEIMFYSYGEFIIHKINKWKEWFDNDSEKR